MQETLLFRLKRKAQRCLRYFDYNYLDFIEYDKNVDLSNSLRTFHQNVKRLRSKSDELITYFEIDNINPTYYALMNITWKNSN
jgi:bisphosphoglycerate-dependent phosphoglycerate mutase